MAKTNTGLVAYAKAQLGKPYWYGTFGQTATASLLNAKVKQYPSQYSSTRVQRAKSNHIGKRVHDCVGLIKGYIWSSSATATPKYNASQDVSANGMYNACKKKGKIATMPDVKGVLVFMDGHVGVYIGDGYVIEARGFDYGVVKTKLSSRNWTKWGYCPYIAYEEDEKATEKPTAAGSTALKVGDKVKIVGAYAASSTAKSAPHTAAKGDTTYITAIYSGRSYPYQLGKKGSTASKDTIGFAKASAVQKV